MSYSRLIETLQRYGRPTEQSSDFAVAYAVDAMDIAGYDIPGVITTLPTGRVLLVIEGKKELVGPLIEAAFASAETMSSGEAVSANKERDGS